MTDGLFHEQIYCYEFDTPVTGDVNLAANWTPTNYTITYELNNWTGTEANSWSYTIESGDITLINPTREGYDFQGWSWTAIDWLTGEVIIAQWSTWNRTYEANWTPINYTITYENWITEQVLRAKFMKLYNRKWRHNMINPTREGYDFQGWSWTAIDWLTGEVIIAQWSTWDRTYEANWKPKEVNYTIEYRAERKTDPTDEKIYSVELSWNVEDVIPSESAVLTFTWMWLSGNLTDYQIVISWAMGRKLSEILS